MARATQNYKGEMSLLCQTSSKSTSEKWALRAATNKQANRFNHENALVIQPNLQDIKMRSYSTCLDNLSWAYLAIELSSSSKIEVKGYANTLHTFTHTPTCLLPSSSTHSLTLHHGCVATAIKKRKTNINWDCLTFSRPISKRNNATVPEMIQSRHLNNQDILTIYYNYGRWNISFGSPSNFGSSTCTAPNCWKIIK